MGDNRLFLTDEDVRALTEYARKAEQRDELRRMGVPFIVTRTGRPLVARAVIEDLLGIKAPEQTSEVTEIDVGALRDLMDHGQKTHKR